MSVKGSGPAHPGDGGGAPENVGAGKLDKLNCNTPADQFQRPRRSHRRESALERAQRGALLSPGLAIAIVRGAPYQAHVAHLKKTGRARQCGCGGLVTLNGTPLDCDCAFDACAYEALEALARACADKRRRP